MSTSGSVTVKSTKHTNLVFSWLLTGQQAAGNVSEIAWQLLLVADAYGRINSSAAKAWAVTLDGQRFSGTNYIALSPGETKTLAEGSAAVYHNADGTKSFDFSFSQEFSGTFSEVYVGTVSGSGSDSLPPIPRASVPRAGAGTLGSALTVYTDRASDTFTHTLRYTFGSASGLIAENVGASVSWVPPLELASQIPKASSGTATLICETYAGGVLLGTATAAVTLTVPESVAPAVTAAWSDTAGAVSALGAAARGISALKVTVTAEAAYGSAVASYSVRFDGKTYAGRSVTTAVAGSAGNLTLTVTATDRRGHTGSRSYTVQVLDYAVPRLVLSASRCTADGTPDDTGEFAKVSITGSVSPVGGNTGSLKLTYGKTTVDMEMSASSGDFSGVKIVPAASTTTLSLSAVVTDRITSVKRSMVLSSGYATMDFLAGGRGVALGKSATREGFDCAMPAFFGSLNGLGFGELSFSGGKAELAVAGPGVVVLAVAGSASWAVYLAAVGASAITEVTRLAGALTLSVSLADGIMTVSGAPSGAKGWRIGKV